MQYRCHQMVLLVSVCDIYYRYIYICVCYISEQIVCTSFVWGEIYTYIVFLKGHVVMHIWYGHFIANDNLIHMLMSYTVLPSYIYVYGV